jgi:Flp pilus assembly protein TadD
MLYSLSDQIARHALLYFAVLGCAALFLLCPSLVRAQGGGGVDAMGTGGRHTIKGRIYFPSGRRSDMPVKVKLESYNSGELSILSDANGTFSFTGLAPGSYAVVVDGGDDYESVREPVYIETDGASSKADTRPMPISRQYTIQISLQPKRRESPKPGVINAALASVPTAARDLYQEAVAAAQAGDSKKAIDELRGALSVYPEFPQALSELGIQYMKLAQMDKAAATFEALLKLKSDDSAGNLNLGIALYNQGIALFNEKKLDEAQKKLDGAESHLREAIKLNSPGPTAHYYLGMTLIRFRAYDEARKELELAISNGGENLPQAHRYLGGLYQSAHLNKEAADELEKYLNLDPKAADAERIRGIIKELRSAKQ